MDSQNLHSQNTGCRIRRLSENLVNQIAAGEVVERPASVIKECIENSLDAGATRIEVWLTDGGMTEIAILDNGHGIYPEDMELATERHATSKIQEASDLEAIATFGFRGEALSSIASVAELELKSRTQDSPSGYLLTLNFGEKVHELRPIGYTKGTSIRVRKLFEKIPARKKYLKSLTTELSHCSRLVRELALGAPGVSFFLYHQGTLLHRYTATTRADRFHEVFKCPWEPFAISAQSDSMNLEAFLSPPEVSLGRGELFLFINGRAVRNRTLMAAVKSCYSQALGPDREPSGVLYLDLRKDWVDVNVHPQKWEVRCLRQEALYPWIVTHIRKHLAEHFPVSSEFENSEEMAFPSHSQTLILNQGIKYLGQWGSYLLCESNNAIEVIDPHALQELSLAKTTRLPLPRKPLSVALMLRLTDAEIKKVNQFRTSLEALGFEIEIFGENEVAVKAIAEMLPEGSAESVVRQVISQFPENGLLPLLCQSVIARGATLDPMQAVQLLQSYPHCRVDELSLHGKPWRFELTSETIEKYFEKGNP